MYYANDEYGIRTNIESADPSGRYSCPMCGAKMIQKRGELYAHHFAHVSVANCDPWYSEKCLWHREWQAQFPVDNQEVPITRRYRRHIADISINDLVIEFQHSSIKTAQFEERSRFYSSGDRKLIWVIDCIREYRSGRIWSGPEDLMGDKRYFHWRQPKQYLSTICPDQTERIDIFLQIEDNLLLKVLHIAGDPSGQRSYKAFWAKIGSKEHFLSYVDGLVHRSR